MDKDMDREMDTDKDKDTDKDTDMDMNMDMDTDMDTDTDVDIKFSYFFFISIWRYSRYSSSSVCITCDTSRRKFQRRHKLVALPSDGNYDRQILKNLYRCWNCFPKVY
jgi:hypothetical protein